MKVLVQKNLAIDGTPVPRCRGFWFALELDFQ